MIKLWCLVYPEGEYQMRGLSRDLRSRHACYHKEGTKARIAKSLHTACKNRVSYRKSGLLWWKELFSKWKITEKLVPTSNPTSAPAFLLQVKSFKVCTSNHAWIRVSHVHCGTTYTGNMWGKISFLRVYLRVSSLRVLLSTFRKWYTHSADAHTIPYFSLDFLPNNLTFRTHVDQADVVTLSNTLLDCWCPSWVTDLRVSPTRMIPPHSCLIFGDMYAKQHHFFIRIILIILGSQLLCTSFFVHSRVVEQRPRIVLCPAKYIVSW